MDHESPSFTRWEHEHVVEAVQQRLDANPQATHCLATWYD
jgi:hypothetical protein